MVNHPPPEIQAKAQPSPVGLFAFWSISGPDFRSASIENVGNITGKRDADMVDADVCPVVSISAQF